MSSGNEGGEKRPLGAGSCTLQLRQSRSSQYIRSIMSSSNQGWQNGWFYLWNDHGLLPEYMRKMVTKCLAKWGWDAPTVEQKKLDLWNDHGLLPEYMSEAAARGRYCGHGGGRFPQAEPPSTSAVSAAHVGDDPQCTLRWDVNAGAASAHLRDLSLSFQDGVLGVEELSGHPDAS